jgi:hypothetical protein
MKLYRYVGPKPLLERLGSLSSGFAIHKADDVRAWIRTLSPRAAAGSVTATFVVNAAGELLLADRRSEHVACAHGEPVLAAGEMTFLIGDTIEVLEVTNQSTGYCPEPACWPSVATALCRAHLSAPDGFTKAFEFRRCNHCNNVTLIKDAIFECGMCGSMLPVAYNVQ